MGDLEHARLLLILVDHEIEALDVMAKSFRVSPEIFGFHAQQAVEKSLKAWLSLKGVSYPKTHDLRGLLRLLESSGAKLIDEVRSLQWLTPYAVHFRYEGAVYLPEHLDRETLVMSVRKVAEYVGSLVRDANGTHG
ncbi:MAG: hypothetical protein GHCLOJNM_00054 [bacterium]|nr:hypothetical protein [bacterium]